MMQKQSKTLPEKKIKAKSCFEVLRKKGGRRPKFKFCFSDS